MKQCKDDDDDESNEFVLTGFKVVTVFDISQTDGEELPMLNYSYVSQDDPIANYELLMAALINFSKFNVIYSANLGEAMGLCDYDKKEILLNIKYSKKHIIATLIHEISHSELHNPNAMDLPINLNMREMEAESVSYIVCAYFNISYGEFTFRYISSYCKEIQLYDFLKSGERIKKLAITLIDSIESFLVSDIGKRLEKVAKIT